MNHDLEDAIRYALEPETPQATWMLCPHCGATIQTENAHVCRTNPLEFFGGEGDEKRRAKSYAIE